MADVRDLIVAEKPRVGVPRPQSVASRLRLALRHMVVASSVPPLKWVYGAIYRAHIWYAARVLREAPGVRAVYVARGAVSKDVVYGISDIDLIVLGEWTEEEQAEFGKRFGRLLASSPLYDHTAVTQTNTLESLRSLYESDYFFQFRFDWARRQSILIHGEDVLRSLPPVPAERVRGGYVMELKLMWMMYMSSAFGDGPTSTDRLFRNSIAVKHVASSWNMQWAVETGQVEYSRGAVLQQALQRTAGEDRVVAGRMERCWASRYLRYEGDVRNDSFHAQLRAIERVNRGIAGRAPFDAVAGARLRVDAPAEEVIRSEGIDGHVEKVVGEARRGWRGYRGAFLLPRNSFAGVDELQLLIEVDPEEPPTVEQVRAVCSVHASGTLRQRVALYLLLPDGAYLLERQSPLEFWQVLLQAAGNPECFALLERPGFAVDGEPRGPAEVRWTRFAADQVEHEMTLRRSAMARMGGQAKPSPLHMLRGIWRQLQLEVIQRSSASGCVVFPLTVPAVIRGMRAAGLPELPILAELESAYRMEIQGQASRAAELIPQAISIFSKLQQAR